MQFKFSNFSPIKFCFLFVILFFISYKNVFSAGINNPRLLGQDCSSEKPSDLGDAKEIKIEYAGRDDIRYGGSRSSPLQLIVWHDPGSNSCDLWSFVRYGHTVAPPSHVGCAGNICGYTFYIGIDGKIVQGAPMNMKTNHFRQSNHNSIGVSLICAGKKTNLPQPQVDNSLLLSEALRMAYGFNQMVPHDKAPSEGVYITNLARSKQIDQNKKFIINYSLGGGQNLYCKIEGKIPPCSSNCSNNGISGVNVPGSSGTNPGFSSPYSDGQGNFIGDSADWGYPFMNPKPASNMSPIQSLLKSLFSPSSNPQSQPNIPTTQPHQNPTVQSTATPTPVINSVIINQVDPSCTKDVLKLEKQKYDYYLEKYNKSYKKRFDEWYILLNQENQKSFFESLFAKFYARKIESSFKNIIKCDSENLSPNNDIQTNNYTNYFNEILKNLK